MHDRLRSTALMAAVLLVTFPFSLPACSADRPPHGRIHAGPDQGLIGVPGVLTAADRTIEISLTSFAFSPDAVQVAPGETLHFVLINDTDTPHEFTIGTPDMHREHRQEMLAMMQSGGTADMHGDPNAILVAPKARADLYWRFPQVLPSGTALGFACDIPGHAEAGMTGTFTLTSN